MANTVQWRGGTAAEHGNFTGAAREVTVETDTGALRVHDGSTVGGTRIATEAELKQWVTSQLDIQTHEIADINGLQAALDATVKTTGDQTIEGTKTFSAKIVASAGVQGKADSAGTSDDAQSMLAAFQEFATENNIV